jgi:two-component system response regulator AtoC/two-component system response regulator HupR/HoxA
LAEHFLRKYSRRNARAATTLAPEAKAALASYDFPGNARELENVVERAAILARGDQIQPEHLAFSSRRPQEAGAHAPPPVSRPTPVASTEIEPHAPEASTRDLGSRLEDMERRELLTALERCNGNKAEVARSLGIQRTTLYYRLKRLGIEA